MKIVKEAEEVNGMGRQQGKKPPSESGVGWKRIVRGTFRWTWFPFSCLLALALGLTIGYVQFGNASAGDLLQLDTWRHLLDLVFAES